MERVGEQTTIVFPETHRVTGGLFAVAGLVTLAFAAVLGSGLYGGGQMYFLSASLGITSMAPFLISVYILCKEPRLQVQSL